MLTQFSFLSNLASVLSVYSELFLIHQSTLLHIPCIVSTLYKIIFLNFVGGQENIFLRKRFRMRHLACRWVWALLLLNYRLNVFRDSIYLFFFHPGPPKYFKFRSFGSNSYAFITEKAAYFHRTAPQPQNL